MYGSKYTYFFFGLQKVVPGQEINIVYGGGVLNNDRIFQVCVGGGGEGGVGEGFRGSGKCS